jgi:DNA-binding NtrC family response regulator
MTIFEKLRTKAILLLDPDPWTRDSLSLLLAWSNCRLASLETVEEGRRAIESTPFDLVICAHRVPGLDGLAFLELCRKIRPEATRILMGPCPELQFAEDAKRIRIHGWLPKPLTIESLEKALSEALSASRLPPA